MIRPTFPAALGAAALLVALAACGGGADDAGMAAGDTATATIGAAPADSAAVAAAAAQGAMIDPDSVTRDQLVAIPGVTAPAADALIAGRPYQNMLAVDQALAPHLGEAERDSIYARVWRPIDPTTASDEEILLIPGIGPRMLGEFKEYRPWTSIEQFRREMGKYVDDAEVARMEKYIVIR